MASPILLSSGSLPSTTTLLMRGDHSLSTHGVSSLQATPCRRTGSAAPSRGARIHALDEPTSSGGSSSSAAAAAVTEEGKGGGGGGGGGCPGCGKAEILGGCNGEGRIQGGIGSLPGLKWFPIKAYRPCPAFIEVGGRYRRIGQSLEEVAFGRKGKEDDQDISERIKG